MSKKLLFILVLTMATAGFAQRKGSVDTGGLFSFQSNSGDSSYSNFDVRWVIGYHWGRSTATEFEPVINMNFQNGQSQVSTILLVGISQRIFDIVPDDYARQRYRKRDLGSAAGVYGNVKAGMWIDGFSNDDEEQSGDVYSGPALSLGIGTRSAMSKSSVLRVQADVIYLMPNGPIYDEPRTIFKIGVGFSVFVVL